jgi:hypothetical protein
MTNPFETQGVFYSADLPLSWTPLDQLHPSQSEQWQHHGIMLLHALSVIEMPLPEPERDTPSSAGKAMERLEAKLDLTLSLMIQLARQQTELPLPHAVILRADSVEWLGESAPEAGQLLLISLHISPKLPQALMLPARVGAVEEREQGVRVRAEFTGLNEEMAEWLERTLFRFHRRGIQQIHSRQRGEA